MNKPKEIKKILLDNTLDLISPKDDKEVEEQLKDREVLSLLKQLHIK